MTEQHPEPDFTLPPLPDGQFWRLVRFLDLQGSWRYGHRLDREETPPVWVLTRRGPVTRQTTRRVGWLFTREVPVTETAVEILDAEGLFEVTTLGFAAVRAPQAGQISRAATTMAARLPYLVR